MNSSIFSFRQEFKTVVLGLCGLLLAEAGLRFIEHKLSLDVVHIRQIPKIASAVGAESGRQPLLFMGNSLCRYGVQPNTLSAELESAKYAAPAIFKVNPDSATVAEWYYYFKNGFVSTRQLPKTLAICFSGGQISDNYVVRSSKLGAYCCTLGNALEVFQNDIPDFGSRVDWLLSLASVSYGNRERIKKRALDKLCPNYRVATTAMNDVLKERQKPEPAGAEASYTRLNRLLRLARENNVRTVLVAMPLPRNYAIDPRAVETIQREGGVLLDCHNAAGLTFFDGMHLDPRSALVFSQTLGQRLAENAELLGLQRRAPDEGATGNVRPAR